MCDTPVALKMLDLQHNVHSTYFQNYNSKQTVNISAIWNIKAPHFQLFPTREVMGKRGHVLKEQLKVVVWFHLANKGGNINNIIIL